MEITDVARIYNAGRGCLDRTCGLCGRYFVGSDTVAVLIAPQKYRKEYSDRLGYNMLAHMDEVEKTLSLSKSIDMFWEVIGKSKKPKVRSMSEEEIEICKKFEIAVSGMGYYFLSWKRNGIKCKKARATDILEYSATSDTVSYSNKRKGYMFDRLVEMQIKTTAWNRFCDICGREQDKREKFNAIEKAGEMMNDAVKRTNEMFGIK